MIPLGTRQFTLNGRIGGGSFGVIWGGSSADLQIAIKRVAVSDNFGRSVLEQEGRILEHIASHGGCPYIPTYIGSYQDRTYLYMGLEFCSGGDLCDKIQKEGPLSEDLARRFLNQIAKALEKVHDLGITHGDVKPENLLLNGGQNSIKLADFGSAKLDGLDLSGTEMACTQTTAYCPPELFLGEKYASSCDVWSLGVIFFVMLFGKHPFDLTGRSSSGKIEANIVSQDIEKILRDPKIANKFHISEENTALLRAMLSRNAQARPTAKEVVEWI